MFYVIAPSETGALKENNPQLEKVKADLVDVGKHVICAREDIVRQSLQFQESLEDIKKTQRCLEEKLDALLARLGEKE